VKPGVKLLQQNSNKAFTVAYTGHAQERGHMHGI